MKINKALLILISLYCCMSYSSDEISEEDKKWLLLGEYQKSLKNCSTKKKLEEFFQSTRKPYNEFIFFELEERFILNEEEKMNDLRHAIRLLNFLSKKNFLSNNYKCIHSLMEKIKYKDKNERDTIFIKLIPYLQPHVDHGHTGESLLDYLPNIHDREFMSESIFDFSDPSDINKIFYINKVKFYSDLIKEINKMLLLKPEETRDSSLRSIFKPTLYLNIDEKVVTYTYKEIIDLKNKAWLYLKCLKEFGKNNGIKVPTVLNKFIINNYIIGTPFVSYINIQEEICSFMEYCHYIEKKVPLLIKDQMREDKKLIKKIKKTEKEIKKIKKTDKRTYKKLQDKNYRIFDKSSPLDSGNIIFDNKKRKKKIEKRKGYYYLSDAEEFTTMYNELKNAVRIYESK